MAVNPLVIEDAGVPGAANSYYSAEKTLVTVGTGAKDLVPEIGWIMFEATAATTVSIRTDDSPATYVVLIAAATGGMIWSDGSNIFASKTSGGAGTIKYFVVAYKP